MKEAWERPITTRIYLHPPFSERLAVLFRDFKLVNSELQRNGPHLNQNGTGFLFLHGDCEYFDFEKTAFAPVTGGLPIYQIHTVADGCEISLTAFCNAQRNPDIYAKLTVKNPNCADTECRIMMLPGSGEDKYLTNLVTEGYQPYRPGLGSWLMLKKNWQFDETQMRLTDGIAHMQLRCDEGIQMQWVDLKNEGKKQRPAQYCTFDFSLQAGEEKSVYLVQRFGEAPARPCAAYETAYADAVSYWQGICDEIRLKPDTENEKIQQTYRHLVIQCLQMLAHYAGEEAVTPRQGDFGRNVWPWEAIGFLMPLDRIGLHSYTDPAYRWMIDRLLVKDAAAENVGQITTFGQQWSNMTGSTLLGISEHLLQTKDVEQYRYYKPFLHLMFDWIERERRKAFPGAYAGIFPPGKGCDWNQPAQYWCHTDALNALAERRYAQMLAAFQDGDATAVANAAEAYTHRLQEIAEELYRGHAQDESFFFPGVLNLSEDAQEYLPYTVTGSYLLFAYGILSVKHPAFKQMENYYAQRGLFEHDLTGYMTNTNSHCPGIYGFVYYVIVSEVHWIRMWLERQDVERAQRTMNAILTYGLTEEYVTAERYCAIDAAYSPWQPNASGSGRLLDGLLHFYGERKK